jgi:L-asparaginase/Glu-tRNA(Gln) amidotransferase subunit D
MSLLIDPFNLKNLKIVDPKLVVSFVKKVNGLSQEEIKGRKLVLALGTGGTISMKIEKGISKPDLDLNKIIEFTNTDMADLFYVECLDIFSTDSAEISYLHTRDLAICLGYIYQNVKVPYEGFIVTHGTDTMSYSAAALSMMMGRGLPFSVVFTGAQKPIQEPMSDAGINIRNSLFLLEALKTADMAEIVIAMAERAMLATSSMKVDDTLIHAFDAPLHKYISKFSALEYPVRLASWLNPKRNLDFKPMIWGNNYSRTFVVHSSLGLDPSVLNNHLKHNSIKAVLLFSYGAGTAHSEIIKTIHKKSLDSKIPAFVVSPVNAEFKVVYESAKQMIDKGFIPLNMTLPAALAKIEVALECYPEDMDKLKNFMTHDYVGEVPDISSRLHPVLER